MKQILFFFLLSTITASSYAGGGEEEFEKFERMKKKSVEEAFVYLAAAASKGHPEACWQGSFATGQQYFPFKKIAPTRDQARQKLLLQSPDRNDRKWLYLATLLLGSKDKEVADKVGGRAYLRKYVEKGNADGFFFYARECFEQGDLRLALKYVTMDIELNKVSLTAKEAKQLEALLLEQMSLNEVKKIKSEVEDFLSENPFIIRY